MIVPVFFGNIKKNLNIFCSFTERIRTCFYDPYVLQGRPCMSILLRPPHVDGPFMRDSTEHCQSDQKIPENIMEVENKEKHGIFETDLLYCQDRILNNQSAQ